MNILIVEPGTPPRAVIIAPKFSSMQEVVGGLIQGIYSFREEIALICNEEGKLMSLPPNRVLRHPESGDIYDIVVGTFFLCAAPSNSENFESLTEDQIQRYSKYFSTLEFFI